MKLSTEEKQTLAATRRAPGRDHKLVGKHTAPCARKKHEDWQHGMEGCVVDERGVRCECTAHWIEVVPPQHSGTKFGQ